MIEQPFTIKDLLEQVHGIETRIRWLEEDLMALKEMFYIHTHPDFEQGRH